MALDIPVGLRRTWQLPPLLSLVVRRVVIGVVLVLIVSALTFILLSLAPGDPAATLLGSYATPAKIAQVRAELGLDHPLWYQYVHWLANLARGNLGESLITQTPVLPDLWHRLPVTLSLVIGTTVFSTLVGVWAGTFSAVRGGAVGRVIDALAMVGFAIPVFWLALVLAEFFAVKEGWFPSTGYVAITQSLGGWIKSLVLPVVTLSLGGFTGIAKQTRDSVLTELSREYVSDLRAAGVTEPRILLRHALKNAAIPIVTMVGVYFIGMLGGSVIVENVFAMPGLGALVVSSASNGDIPVVLGVAVVFCVIVVLVNFLVDLAYGWLNPRART